MKEKWQKWKETWKTEGKMHWVIFLLAGLILLVAAIPTGEKNAAVILETEAVPLEELDKAEELSERLEKVLSRVEGVGEVKVLVTLKSDGKRLVEKDSVSSARTSSGTGDNGSTSQENSQEENTVFSREEGGAESPYVAETMEPEVLGVLVVAKGGDNPVTVNEITEAVQALFGIEVHKIKVMKMS